MGIFPFPLRAPLLYSSANFRQLISAVVPPALFSKNRVKLLSCHSRQGLQGVVLYAFWLFSPIHYVQAPITGEFLLLDMLEANFLPQKHGKVCCTTSPVLGCLPRRIPVGMPNPGFSWYCLGHSKGATPKLDKMLTFKWEPRNEFQVFKFNEENLLPCGLLPTHSVSEVPKQDKQL